MSYFFLNGNRATGQFYPYTIDNSCRFDNASYLYKKTMPAISVFTVSVWVKLSPVGDYDYIFSGNGSSQYWGLAYNKSGDANDGKFYIYNGSAVIATTAVYRDYSAWYHVVFTRDGSGNAKLYINGVEVISTTMSQAIASGSTVRIGDYFSGTTHFHHFSGYMADFHFVDGTAYAPTDFAQYDTQTGTIWQPKEFAGSYGTAGFRLEFGNSANMGEDANGGSSLTPSGIATSDQMLDSPTNNFATLNPLNAIASLSEGGMAASSVTSPGWDIAHSTFSMSSGKWYCEYLIAASSGTYGVCGISSIVLPSAPHVFPGSSTTSYGYYSNNGDKYNVSNSAYGATYTVGDVIGIAFDAGAGTLEFYKNNVSQGVAFTGITGEYYFSGAVFQAGDVVKMNFGNDSSFSASKTRQNNADENGYGDFYYTPPSGYLALCTQNLPTPTFNPAVGASPQDHFSVDLDADGSGALTAAQAVFPTGIWWLKNRTTTGNSDHLLVDSARGSTLELNPNAASAESTYSDPGGSSVAWSWKAASAVSGTTTGSGTLKSYSGYANATAGVSVITYEGNGTAGHQIPHHLGAAPSVVVVKSQDEGTRNWIVYHANTGASPETEHMVLNGTAAAASSSSAWNNTAPSASVVTLGSYAHVNNNTYNNIMYAFAEKNGFSKFGVYQGNFNADGPFVYLGFRPAFVMIKATGGTTGKWCIFDAERDGYNPDNDALHVYPTSSEDTTDQIDFLSNGFKIRGTGADVNSSTYEYIYMAFAEQPFKYSTAR